jgi:hypothetical protein
VAHVDHGGSRKASFAFAQSKIAGRRGELEVECNRCNDQRGDAATVEAIVLQDERGTVPSRL